MLVFLVRFYLCIYLYFFHFSFDSKSIGRKHTLADIHEIRIVFSHPPPLPACFAN